MLCPNTNPRQLSAKIPRFYNIFACVDNLSLLSQKPMLILINNYLPFICLNFGSIKDEENNRCLLIVLPFYEYMWFFMFNIEY